MGHPRNRPPRDLARIGAHSVGGGNGNLRSRVLDLRKRRRASFTRKAAPAVKEAAVNYAGR